MFYYQCSQAENAILDSLNNCIQPDSLELCVQDVQELITTAAEKSIPLKKSGYHKVLWWSVELFCMRKQLNAARRRYQRKKNSVLKEFYREIYFQIRIKYKFKLHESKMNSWKSFLADITVHNVWKKFYTYGMKTNFTKSLEISGIEVSSSNFTSSFEDTIDAVMRKSFPCDPISHDNFQLRVLSSDAELVYESDDDVPFSRTEIDSDLTLGNVTKNRALEKGCPQGSVMGPFLWNLIMNDLLCNISKFQNSFSTDVLLIVQSKHFQDVCTLSQNILNKIFDWSELYKLEFNPLKTKVMKIYKKSIVDQRINLKLGGVIIEEVLKIKYLGIIVDNKMQWEEYISYVSSKSEKILLGLLRISSNTFGVKTEILQLIYISRE
ncbi:uncharacterized protein TNIN_387811 [Trichonephila inaurata madagascariensis]|uniref:Reverse transcriptase domain-containing protein n=1 Tax=Trichonephila inaurata madagascariensis TaxID=2747483 RepID=A0A8X7CP21_9ARAC|nr:uncharacterized protein TNIN_387811 [Trichonephila inaurata madagascariensis]